MKTTTTLVLVGGLAYLGWRMKQSAEAAVASAALPPPPNSGPVVNGLSFYELEGLSGFGSSFKKTVKKATSSVKKLADNKVMKVPLAVATGGASLAMSKSVKTLEKKSPLFKRVSKSPNKTPPAAGQQVIYQDANGNPISEAQYNTIVQAMQSGQPIATAGGWALPQGYISSVNPNKPVAHSPPLIPPGKVWGSTPAYEENLTVTNSYSDDYGSSPATPHTASPAGSPGLPSGITTDLSTPAAQEAAPLAPPESNTGKYLVGTALAAGAAYLAFA